MRFDTSPVGIAFAVGWERGVARLDDRFAWIPRLPPYTSSPLFARIWCLGTEATAEKEFSYNSGNVSTAPDPVQPETKPTVKVEEITLDDNSKALRVTMSYKNKIASCQLNFNGQDYDVTIDQDQTNPLTFSLPLQNGANTIKLKVIGTDNTVTEFENTYSN